jgi:RNA polymerase sigma-70 factor (ECF subfamily)
MATRALHIQASQRALPAVAAPRANERSARQREALPLHLVVQAQRGSRRAFELLWQRSAPSVQSVLMTMVGEDEARDLAQEVALVALRSIGALRNGSSFPAWITAIARNMGRDALKEKARTGGAPIEDAAAVAAAPSGDGTVAEEILAQVRALPECYREPLMMRLLLDLTGPEIAEHTGMAKGSVRVNLCRGMKLLRRRLRALGVIDDE